MEKEASDPYNLRRFTRRQETDHTRALRELRKGRKQGCWSWWIFPTPPFIRNGQRVGSPTNFEYEIENDDEGIAYLKFANLRENYLAVVGTANDQLAAGTKPAKLLGIDVPRFEASTRYFLKLGDLVDDKELSAVCERSHALLHPEKDTVREDDKDHTEDEDHDAGKNKNDANQAKRHKSSCASS